MGYLYTVLAALCGVTKGYCGKKTGEIIREIPDVLLTNCIRMGLCIPLGFLLVCLNDGTGALSIGTGEFSVCFLNGTAMAAFLVLWLFMVRRGAYMLLDVFLTAGVLIPLLLCRLFFDDRIPLTSVIGFVILVVATLFMVSYNNQIRKKLDKTSVLLLFLCGISDNLCSFAQQWRSHSFAVSLPSSVFNFYTFAVACVWLCIGYAVARRRFAKTLSDVGETQDSLTARLRKILPYLLVMAVALFLNSYFGTLAANLLSSSEQYPLMRGLALTLSLLMSHFLFGERIKPRCLIGIGLTALALFVINILPALLSAF